MGNPADPFTSIDGCRFHPRCPNAQDKCRSQRPQFDGQTACHFPIAAETLVAS
jgi:peptide/nickel transport system ATP-binding protein